MKKIILILVFIVSFSSCKKGSYSLHPINQEEFAKLNTSQIQLLDVRTPEEFKEGAIEGAVSINFYDKDFIQKVNAKFDKSKPLYLYCASSGRSTNASSKLIMKKRFTEIYYLVGGYNNWTKKQQK